MEKCGYFCDRKKPQNSLTVLLISEYTVDASMKYLKPFL